MKYWVTVNGREVEVEVVGDTVMVDGSRQQASLDPVAGTALQSLTRNGAARTLVCESLGRGQWAISMQGRALEVEVLDQRSRHIRSLSGTAAGQGSGGVLKAPMPGLVVRVQVEPGQQVQAGAPLVVLEAMKMENQLKAPAAGMIAEVRVVAGAAVEKGQVLVMLKAEG
ncbi:MAG TPA: biotin/lipoyl-containing protein [Gemmatimonadales bacterium]